MGPERADLGSERADLGPEKGRGGTYGRTYGRTDVWKFTPVTHFTPEKGLGGGCTDVRTDVRTSGNSPL